MIVEELQAIVTKAKRHRVLPLYIKSMLKEHLQAYVLNFIYQHRLYNKLFVFTGGTCLRLCYGLNRLSEDLDFDLKKQLNTEELKASLEAYFNKEYLYTDLQLSVLQRGTQFLLKFPVLQKLELASESESDNLFVKIDLSPMTSTAYEQDTTLTSIQQFNFLVIHYSLPSLMAGKLHAILFRNKLIGIENSKVIKGRDYFDLLWFLQKQVYPDMNRLNQMLSSDFSLSEIVSIMDKKVEEAVTIHRHSFKQDLLPFIDNPSILDGYISSYSNNYQFAKQYLLSV